MSEVTFHSPEVQALVKKHFAEDIAAGLYASYIQSRDNQLPIHGETSDVIVNLQREISSLARSEAPLFPVYDHYPSGNRIYFLVKVDPVSGKEIRILPTSQEDYDIDTLEPMFDLQDGEIIVDKYYTQDQARLIMRHVCEFESIGCDLANLDSRKILTY